jgi:hypothetical protein
MVQPSGARCPGKQRSEQVDRTKTVRNSDIARCPRRSLLPSHYNEDGSCQCCGVRCPYLVSDLRCVLDAHEGGKHRGADGRTWEGGEK